MRRSQRQIADSKQLGGGWLLGNNPEGVALVVSLYGHVIKLTIFCQFLMDEWVRRGHPDALAAAGIVVFFVRAASDNANCAVMQSQHFAGMLISVMRSAILYYYK